MSIDVLLRHRTGYRYDREIQLGPQSVRLRPAPHCRTKILGYAMTVRPESHYINWQQDPFSNYNARLNFREKTREFEVIVELIARMDVINPFNFFLEDYAEKYPFKYDAETAGMLKPFLEKGSHGKKFAEYLKSLETTSIKTVDYLVDINARLSRDISYLIRMEPGVQAPEETLEKGSGSCRDSGWLLVELLRHLGLAARFVSGYLIQLKPDMKSLDGPSGAEKDFTDLHAWAEVYLPGAGWVGLDPTSGLLAGEGHIPLACTPKPGFAAPISGGLEECDVEFEFDMTLERVRETPRVTLPYTEETWAKVLKLGDTIDERLDRMDVGLTMGGEPTFVSIDDFEGEEWKTEALGEEKLKRSEDLMQRLFNHYGKGGFLHHGQGKWYPGESLPRWALSCYWRKDGEPAWSNPKLLSQVSGAPDADEKDALAFSQLLTSKLKVDSEKLIPGYEDAFYYLWKERRLPVNLDPFKSKLDTPEDRARLAQIFEQGLDKVIGYVLPLERSWRGDAPGWITGNWFLRSERMYLIPGDSPMGFRLPLDSIPWAHPHEISNYSDMPFFENLPELPEAGKIAGQYQANPSGKSNSGSHESPWLEYLRRVGGGQGKLPPHMRARPGQLQDPDHYPPDQTSANWIVRKALCIQPRDGHLNIFLPPVSCTEDYIDLLSAVEATAAELSLPVRIEGYTPPGDPRMEVLQITPDPGVIEVNIHPSKSWKSLVEKTEFLYEAARKSRLGTEKFDLDGTHTGTGGGNHVIIGGETPMKSPLLKRPDLLTSLLAYWLNHPSLSYLFSGMFVGPTSQAPRIDEARDDALYELEIAMRELKKHQSDINGSPWLVDRLFRNILVDITGNTHRAEFCIDKLFPPENASRRLGLVEFRAFEMPPHERMSLVQQLLLRGLVSEFWENPYKPEKLTRWHTQLHDKWMLPHFISRDMQEVCSDLRTRDLPFDYTWFKPHLEFRFPKIGEIQYNDISMELRNAIEPWHVMGEEGSQGGTVRYVDSSLERLQVKLNGLTPDRYLVLCQGQRVPLHKTGVEGEYVAGVRYRAWQPSSCLHPTIPVHSPLIFKIIDKWTGEAIQSCSYHVEHPGGLNPGSFPVNAFEAESRRAMRFSHSFSNQLTDHDIRSDTHLVSPEFPYTLDLRNPVKLSLE